QGQKPSISDESAALRFSGAALGRVPPQPGACLSTFASLLYGDAGFAGAAILGAAAGAGPAAAPAFPAPPGAWLLVAALVAGAALATAVAVGAAIWFVIGAMSFSASSALSL